MAAQGASFPKRRWSRSGEGGGRRLFRPRDSAASNAKGEPGLRKRKRQSARRRKPPTTRRGGAARDRAAAKSLRHDPARRVVLLVQFLDPDIPVRDLDRLDALVLAALQRDVSAVEAGEVRHLRELRFCDERI